MMKLIIEINLDNDAFVGQLQNHEIRKCLNQVMDKIDDEYYNGVMHDTNGNKVGLYDIIIDENYVYHPCEANL